MKNPFKIFSAMKQKQEPKPEPPEPRNIHILVKFRGDKPKEFHVYLDSEKAELALYNRRFAKIDKGPGSFFGFKTKTVFNLFTRPLNAPIEIKHLRPWTLL